MERPSSFRTFHSFSVSVIHYSVILYTTVTTGINIIVLHLLTSFLFLATIIIHVVPLIEEIGLSAQCTFHVDLDPQGGMVFSPHLATPVSSIVTALPSPSFNVLLGSPWTSLFNRHTGDNSPLLVPRFESNLKYTITPNRVS